MSLTPPAERIWWNEPVEKTEVLWVTIALIWCLIMFFMMPYWHYVGEQNISDVAYKVNPEAYVEKVEAFADENTVGEEGDTGIPIVRPTENGDVYLLARLWEWWPILELKKGQTVRLHLSSADWVHGFHLAPENINIQVHPEYMTVMNITPTRTGEYGIICNEYCGIGHHQMVGKIYVTE